MNETEKGPTVDIDTVESQTVISPNSWLSKAAAWGVELRGITPVPFEEKTDTRYINIFFLWFSMSANLLPIVTGMVGTFSYGLSLRDSSLAILFFCALGALPPAYLGTFGPRTGLRQMLHARYTFGYYFISIIVALNLCTNAGFGVIMCVLGGSTLSAVSEGSIDATAGIVVIALIGMVISFGGMRFLHQFERYSWIPALVAIIIATGIGGRHLSEQTVTEAPAAATIVSFGGVVAGFMIPWGALASDFAVYCHPDVSTFRIFAYTYAGLFVPTVPLMVLGAALGGATANVPAWNEGYNLYNVGGVLEALLSPAHGFGKFIAVLLALSVLGNLAGTMYSISLNFQLIIPWLIRVPRFVFATVYTTVLIPVAIQAAKSFFDSLENFIYLIAYWAAAFVSIVAVEHFGFRKGRIDHYNLDAWNIPNKLPSGIAAISAAALSFGLVVPCMDQTWFVGPIAETTGDLGFEVALVLAPMFYLPFRSIEIRYRGFT